MNENVKVNAALDDMAYDVAKFVQELSKVQDDRFTELYNTTLENKWVEGMDKEELSEWLFDYVFNGYNIATREIEDTFSEYI
jgi:hypothetical protein